MQRLLEPELPLCGGEPAEAWRVLLWADLHVRAVVRLPELVRMSCYEERVRSPRRRALRELLRSFCGGDSMRACLDCPCD